MKYLKLIRIQQWVKNLFLFAPAFFGAKILDIDNVSLIPGFIAFCFISSAVYVINDYRDIEADRAHPSKKDRPLAAGTINKSTALFVFIGLLITSIGISINLDLIFTGIILFYFLLNVGYSFGLKNVPILETFIVSTGFLLRVIAGAIITDTPLSHWIIIMVFLLALFLILAKRRDDLVIYLNTGTAARKSIMGYNLEFIDACLTMLSAVIIVCYITYCVSPDTISHFNNEYLYGTTIFVIAGIMRYMKMTLMDQKSGSPVKALYTDRFIIITLVLWIVSFFIIIYSNKL